MALALRLTVTKAEPLRRGQDHLWRVIRTLGAAGPFTAGQVAHLSDETDQANVSTFLRRLEAAGHVQACGDLPMPGRRASTLWRLLRDQQETPRLTNAGEALPPSGQQAMWNVVRGPMARAGFTWRDLVAWGSTDLKTIPEETAKSFVKALARGGYLIRLDPGGPGRPAVWRLRPAMNTGPKPPLLLRAKLVFDQNRGAVVGEATAEEEPS